MSDAQIVRAIREIRKLTPGYSVFDYDGKRQLRRCFTVPAEDLAVLLAACGAVMPAAEPEPA